MDEYAQGDDGVPISPAEVPAGRAPTGAAPASLARIGCSSRVNGFSTSPKISSVTAPSSAASPGSPRMTGVWPCPWGSVMWHSPMSRTTWVPSASEKRIVRAAASPMARQTSSGSRV
jgi:hypothetical protein